MPSNTWHGGALDAVVKGTGSNTRENACGKRRRQKTTETTSAANSRIFTEISARSQLQRAIQRRYHVCQVKCKSRIFEIEKFDKREKKYSFFRQIRRILKGIQKYLYLNIPSIRLPRIILEESQTNLRIRLFRKVQSDIFKT